MTMSASAELPPLPSELRSLALRPRDHGYEDVRHTYVYRGAPALVLRPRTAEEVAAALAYARPLEVPLAVRSGGHGISGRSTNDGGIVIDLGALRGIEVADPARRLVTVGAGARWGEVAAELAPHGWAISSGDTGDVGVGGLATAGGIGWLVRAHGLTIDRVRAADLVLADGTLVRADAEHHPDLFWGVRGAGANLAVATSFDIEASEVGGLVLAVTAYDVRDPRRFLPRWAAAVEAAPRSVTSFLTLVPHGPSGTPVGQAMTVYDGDDPVAARQALAPLLDAGPQLGGDNYLLRYPDLVRTSGQAHAANQPLSVARSGLLDHLTEPVA
ncbi:MAG: hypothetical protein QOF98_1688, partial [Streptomyces sp.]|nr:hypothetical protein [Streptomyces sp.]